MNRKLATAVLLLIATLAALPTPTRAQAIASEDFTGATNVNKWYFFSGACLTAGTTNATGNPSPGQIPSCASLRTTPGLYYDSYYTTSITSHPYFDTRDEPLVGGNSGNLDAQPDTPTTGGALRFTNEPTVKVLDANGNNILAGYYENGAIVSQFPLPLALQGIHVQFTTETYSGDGGGGDGADGISFFLQDASYPADLGATGGSLSYSCSNVNYDPTMRANGTVRGYDGLVGAYIGVGIDEFGNFNNPGDNTSTGPGFGGNRIGIRGAGVVGWQFLSTSTLTQQYYPQAFFANAVADGSVPASAVATRITCQSGFVWDYSTTTATLTPHDTNLTTVGATTYKNPYNATPHPEIPIPDYADIAYVDLPSTAKIANERGPATAASGSPLVAQQGWFRGYNTPQTNLNPTPALALQYGVPITYDLTITAAGVMSFAFSYAGGAYQHVVDNRQITANNGNLPAYVRFGFASSDGAASNIHELLCFQASPPIASQSSASTNQKQSAPVIQGSQVYFSSYNSNTWAGSVFADSLVVNADNTVSFSSLANWDASCVLTQQTTCTNTGQSAAYEAPGARTMLTFNGVKGQPFEWASLSAPQQAALDTGDPTITPYRQAYFRGDRSQEVNIFGSGQFRARASVLGDVIDSSPTWVGPPSHQYADLWSDNYDVVSPTSIPENASGAQTYSAYVKQEASRLNVVYAGANDGFLHGFRAGYFNNGVYVGTGTGANFVGTDNDGQELLAYMPAYVLNQIQTTVSSLDYSSQNYGHQFEVDATPGSDDVFYNNAWHTIIVGGLGPGGAAIYALDVTNPGDGTQDGGNTALTEANAAGVVIGEWSTTNATTTSSTGVVTAITATATTLNCVSGSTTATPCGYNLGNTYGTPAIRRFHNGSWGAVFGNGFGSSTGDAGIYVMLLDPNAMTNGQPTVTFYYLSTGTAVSATGANANGIAYTTPVDLDNDKITDFVYAGDLQGNIWRFDLRDPNPTKWAVSGTSATPNTPAPIFSANGSQPQPITSKLVAASIPDGPVRRLLIEFGTGQQVPFTNSTPATYAQSQQYLYGIWDANFTDWNNVSLIKYAAIANQTTVSGLANLQQQTYSLVKLGAVGANNGTDYRAVSANPICWSGETCTVNGGPAAGTQLGWYMALASGTPNAGDVNTPLATTATTTGPAANLVYEQVVFNPTLTADVFFVNTTIPATVSLTNCSSTVAGGWTLALNPETGGAFATSVFGHNGVFTDANGILSGLAQNGTGTPFLVTTGSGASAQTFLGTQGSNGQPANVASCKSGDPNCLQNIKTPKYQTGSRLTWIQKR